MKNFKELIIWQKGIGIVKRVYELTKHFPAQEKFGLISQMTRARFFQLALGSAFELQTYLVIVKEMKWASQEEIHQVEIILGEEIKMIHS